MAIPGLLATHLVFYPEDGLVLPTEVLAEPSLRETPLRMFGAPRRIWVWISFSELLGTGSARLGLSTQSISHRGADQPLWLEGTMEGQRAESRALQLSCSFLPHCFLSF